LGDRPGQGGPNQEFAVALACALKGASGIWALAADTDGIDGNSGAAGGLVGPDFLACAPGAEAALLRHDVAGVLAEAGALLTPGPTMTNVNDLRAVLIL
jgi:hydroxypyruvate reductase